MTVCAILIIAYYLVSSGIVYDLVVKPPGIGQTQDPITGMASAKLQNCCATGLLCCFPFRPLICDGFAALPPTEARAIRSVPFLPNRINSQYIIEGLSAGFLFTVGGESPLMLEYEMPQSYMR
eukprot:1191963-Prorocentrum_minimum.AAC.5